METQSDWDSNVLRRASRSAGFRLLCRMRLSRAWRCRRKVLMRFRLSRFIGTSKVKLRPGQKRFHCQYQPDRVRCGLSIRSMISIRLMISRWRLRSSYDQDHCFAIEATMPPGTWKETTRLMLQEGLAERFGLKLHWGAILRCMRLCRASVARHSGQ